MCFMQGHELSLELELKFKWFTSFLCHLKGGLFKHQLSKVYQAEHFRPREVEGLTYLFQVT